eukprot:940307-Prymnesium_polylepis.1
MGHMSLSNRGRAAPSSAATWHRNNDHQRGFRTLWPVRFGASCERQQQLSQPSCNPSIAFPTAPSLPLPPSWQRPRSCGCVGPSAQA